MKNIFKTVALLFVIFFTFSSNVSAYELTEKDEIIITKIDKKIFYLIDVKKKFTAEKIVNILDKYNKKKVKNKRLKEILNQVIEDVDYEYCIGEYSEIDYDEDYTEFEIDENQVFMNGEIYKQTYCQFVHLYNENPEIDTLVEEEVPGSNDDETMLKLAYFIHKKGIKTKLLKDSVIQSGGVDLFLAGIERSIEKGAEVGVHSWADSSGKEARDYPKNSSEHEINRKYVEDMLGKDDFYWFTIKAAKANGMYFMTDKEIEKFNLLTK